MGNIAIIILHFGNIKDTLECLKSINKITYHKKPSVYIVNNQDKTITKLRQSNKLTILNAKKNLGYSGGMNLAIKKVLKKNFQYILLLNNDTVVNTKILSQLIKPFNDNRIGICGSIITYYKNSSKIWFAGGKLNKFFCYTQHNRMNKNIQSIKKESQSDFITGAAMMIKKEVFEKIGYFDEEYFLYWEDVDFCLRAKKAGFSSFVVNSPLVKHKVSSSTGRVGENKLSPQRAYFYARNPFLFIKKNKLNAYTSLIGQIFIRFPYYFFSLQNLNALNSYLKGLRDGFKYLFN